MNRKLIALAAVALLAVPACDTLVTDPTGDNPVDLTFAPCIGAPNGPTWFAYQDGENSWKRVTPTANGAFNFTITFGKGGIAMHTASEGLVIIYATTEEMQANLPNCAGAVRSVSTSVSGFTTQDQVAVTLGESIGALAAGTTSPSPLTLTDVDAFAAELVAVRSRSTATPTTFAIVPNNVLIRRNVTGTTTGVLDFTSGTEAGAPVPTTVTVTNLVAGDLLEVASRIETGSTVANLSFHQNAGIFFSGAVTAPFYGLQGSRIQGTEAQALHVSVTRTASASGEESRFAEIRYTDAADQTVTFGPVLGTVTVTPSTRPAASYVIQSAYDKIWDFTIDQGSAASSRRIEVITTRGYLGASATTAAPAVPNLSDVSGFDSAWLPVAGTVATWSFIAASGDLSLLNGRAVSHLGAERTGNFTP